MHARFLRVLPCIHCVASMQDARVKVRHVSARFSDMFSKFAPLLGVIHHSGYVPETKDWTLSIWGLTPATKTRLEYFLSQNANAEHEYEFTPAPESLQGLAQAEVEEKLGGLGDDDDEEEDVEDDVTWRELKRLEERVDEMDRILRNVEKSVGGLCTAFLKVEQTVNAREQQLVTHIRLPDDSDVPNEVFPE